MRIQNPTRESCIILIKMTTIISNTSPRYEPWDKLIGGPLGPVLRVNHEEHVGEAGAKIGSICVVVP